MTDSLPAAFGVRHLLSARARSTPDAIWLEFPETGVRLTWRQACDRARDFAVRAAALKIARDESAAIACPNGEGAVIALMGLLWAGIRVMPVNLTAGPEAVAFALTHSRCRVVFVDSSARPLMDKVFERLTPPPAIIPLEGDGDPHWPESRQDSAPESEEEDMGHDQGMVIYTSGTTGRPRGVVLSQRNLLVGGANAVRAHALTDDDCALCVLPIYHVNGLCVTVMGTLVSGGRLVMPRGFSVSDFWKIITAHECSWFSAVPTMFAYLLNASDEGRTAPASLRFARSASAPLPPEQHRLFEKMFNVPVIETMGLTETSGQILSNPLPPARRKPGSVGLAVGNEVKLVDGGMREVQPGRIGEVVIRGDNVMAEYLHDPDATAQVLDDSGWLRSGDLGRMDREGYVFITGRAKELIIKGGENIAPREIDEALLSHPAVLEAAAFGRECREYGQRVEACVRLKPGQAVGEDELIALCVRQLGPFKAPDCVWVVDDFPRGPSGKVQRLRLAAFSQEKKKGKTAGGDEFSHKGQKQ